MTKPTQGDLTNSNELLEQVQELTWALVDERISDDEMALLENLLLASDEARKRYVECVQLHADLAAHFAGEAVAERPAMPTNSPILGFLNTGVTLLGLQPDSLNEP